MTSYDTVHYQSMPFQQTHPARMGAIARLHGIPATSPHNARVLELGCGNGANLIPMAAAYPGARFVGLDLASTAIDAGKKIVEEMGLKNVDLFTGDIGKVDESIGHFDYIVAHGIFSWVPDPVRDAMFAICQRLLTPNGVAYISYNAMPGCHVREIFWDILKFHTHAIDDPTLKMKQARAVLHLLSEGILVKGPLGDYLKAEARHIAKERNDSVLFHDDLSDNNKGFYFHDFVAQADRHGLQFLSEADYSDMEIELFAPAVVQHLKQLGEMNLLLQQQYRDFLTMRRFRQTLLVRNEAPAQRVADLESLRQCSVAMEKRATPANADLTPGVQVRFQLDTGAALTVDHPFAKAMLAVMIELWPHPLSFAEIVEMATKKLTAAGQTNVVKDERIAQELLLAAFSTGIAVLYLDPPQTARVAPDRPKLSAMARYQINLEQPQTLTNLLHIPVKLEDALTHKLLWCMDGNRDRQEIVAELVRWVAQLAKSKTGDPVEINPEELREQFMKEINAGYTKAAELALLEVDSHA